MRGPAGRTTRSLLKYFETHKERMRYNVLKQKLIPLGSGAVESGARRIVNLRLKGNGIFWTARNAEGILRLRAQVPAGGRGSSGAGCSTRCSGGGGYVGTRITKGRVIVHENGIAPGSDNDEVCEFHGEDRHAQRHNEQCPLFSLTIRLLCT